MKNVLEYLENRLNFIRNNKLAYSGIDNNSFDNYLFASNNQFKSKNNFQRPQSISNLEKISSQESSLEDEELEESLSIEEESEVVETVEENVSTQSDEVHSTETVINKPKPSFSKIIWSSPITYYILAAGIFILFLVGLFLVLFPKDDNLNLKPIMCGGPSKLDNLKIITKGPDVKEIITGKTIGSGPWLDAWDFYDYVAGVVRYETGTGIISKFKGANGDNPEIIENKEYRRGLDFAYYQAQALASLSYALNPDVGDYANEELKASNLRKYRAMCPLLTAEALSEMTEEEVLAYINRKGNIFMKCRADWPEEFELIVAKNSTSHQGACSLDYGCVVYNNDAAHGGELICRYEEIDGKNVLIEGDERCNLKGAHGTNKGKKIYLRENCIGVGKNKDGSLPATYEHTCKNHYCEKFSDDPDCKNHPSSLIPDRAYIKPGHHTPFTGVLTPGISDEQRARNQEAKDYIYEVIESIRGVVLTHADGVAGRADFKGLGTPGVDDILECKGNVHSIYPITRNDMCHAGTDDENQASSWYQSVVLGWPASRIVTYWYDFYISSWSEEGKSRCRVVDFNMEKDLEILNFDNSEDNPNKPIKYPGEKSLGHILNKYEVKLANLDEYSSSELTSEVSSIIDEFSELDEETLDKLAKSEMNSFNNYLKSYASINRIGSGKAVAAAGVGLVKYLYYRDLKLPYSFNMKYDEFGVNPEWGIEESTSVGNWNGSIFGGQTKMPLGLDCVGFTNWAMINGGLKKGFMSQSEMFNDSSYTGAHKYAKKYDADSRRVVVGEFGDVIYHESGSSGYPHSKLVVGYWFNDNGAIVGNIIAEALNPEQGLVTNVVSTRTGKKMKQIYYTEDKDHNFGLRIAPYSELIFDEDKYYIPYLKDGSLIKGWTYVDFCYQDPRMPFDYGAFNVDTSYCSSSGSPDYLLDYSSCYENKNRQKVCEKVAVEDFYKGVFDDEN